MPTSDYEGRLRVCGAEAQASQRRWLSASRARSWSTVGGTVATSVTRQVPSSTALGWRVLSERFGGWYPAEDGRRVEGFCACGTDPRSVQAR